MTVYEVKGFGRTGGKTEVYRGSAHVVDFVPKISIEVVVTDVMVGEVIQVIAATAKSPKDGKAGVGAIGDGKIFVSTLDEAVRIRTGERGGDAI